MTDTNTTPEIPQDLLELIEDTATELDLITTERGTMTVAFLAAYELGKRDEAQSSIDANEYIFETMQSLAAKHDIDAGDLMAYLMLINEYHGTAAQEPDGRIFTTLNFARLAKLLDEYDCFKFYHPHGDVEYQVVRKGGKPAPATTTLIDQEINQ